MEFCINQLILNNFNLFNLFSSAYLSSSFWFNLPLFNYLISEDKKKTKEDVAYIYLQNNNSQHDNDSSYELPFERSNHFTEPNRHWHLLRLAHSENEKIKHSAIKELAIDKFSGKFYMILMKYI